MKNKIMIIAAAGILTVAGLTYGFTKPDNSSCPLEGTSDCPKTNCPLAGTPECPYDNAITMELPSCCKKK
ncbi:hypothetical protein ACA086_05650 [Muriicola sp. E247]|uniref:hypothetical protein n=1 Tax=Muriicola sp. E247 TaxID=3242730 RepID=UPI0035235B6E